MKYSINVNQLVLSKYKDLDIIDGAILDFLGHLCSSSHPSIVRLGLRLVNDGRYV